MDTTQDNQDEDTLQLMREMAPADLERLQRDLAEPDQSGNHTDQRPGGQQ